MQAIINILEKAVDFTANIGIHLSELAGIAVLMITVVQGLIGYFRKDPSVRLNLAEGTALALEFKLGGEVLRTVLVRDWSELMILGAIIALRSVLTLLLHWEIKNEQSNGHLEDAAHIPPAASKK